jgi:predicted phosphodiesterase
MTRLLAFSDIHGATPAVEALVQAETDRFDAVVIAGDIGPQPEEFFRILEPLNCPVFYVYGNWDNRLDYGHSFHDRFFNLHGTLQAAGELRFIGFSGCPTHWGNNPHWVRLSAQVDHDHRAVRERENKAEASMLAADEALEQIGANKRSPAAKRSRTRYRNAADRFERIRASTAYLRFIHARRTASVEAQARNRAEMLDTMRHSGEPPERTIAVTHERLYRLNEDAAALGAHFFGHRHGFKLSKRHGTTFVNVSALDPSAYMGGQYGVIEWTQAKGFQVTPKRLPGQAALRKTCEVIQHRQLRAMAVSGPSDRL